MFIDHLALIHFLSKLRLRLTIVTIDADLILIRLFPTQKGGAELGTGTSTLAALA